MIWKHRQFQYILLYFVILLSVGVVLIRIVQNVNENPLPPKRESFFINIFTKLVKFKRSLLHQNKPLRFSNNIKEKIDDKIEKDKENDNEKNKENEKFVDKQKEEEEKLEKQKQEEEKRKQKEKE